MFKNAVVYRIDHWEPPSLEAIEKKLQAARFVECGPTQPESAGFAAPRGSAQAPLAEAVAGQLILMLHSEAKAVPAGEVRRRLQSRLDAVEKDTGRRPRGKATREIKEGIVHELLPRVFAKRNATPVWVDPAGGRVLIGATAARRTDAAVTQLVECLGGGLRLSPLQTQLSPAKAMATWLAEREAPAGFTVDRECQLEQPDSEKAAVRYARHTLDIDEIAAHIRQGKLPTQLALTWAGRVSFVLTEALAIKRIKLVEGVLDAPGAAEPGDAESRFDADVALVTGELRRLLPDLIDALGGELVREPPGAARPGDDRAATPGDDRAASPADDDAKAPAEGGVARTPAAKAREPSAVGA